MPKLSINLITLNGRKYLPACLESIFNQTFRDFSILIIDNASTDDTVEYLKSLAQSSGRRPRFATPLANKYSLINGVAERADGWASRFAWAQSSGRSPRFATPFLLPSMSKIKIVSHKTNHGFAQAHNEAITWTNSDYLLILNQDIILEPEYLAECVKFLDENKKVGGVTGKLLRYTNFHESITNLHESTNPRIIDSTGLKIFKNHRVVDRGAGEEDRGQYDKTEEVFGVSGACSVFRRKALEDVKLNVKCQMPRPTAPLTQSKAGGSNVKCDEYFDQDFFAYKEDVDLSWRLRLYGWKLFYLPEARAYHVRTAVGDADLLEAPTKKAIKTRIKKPQIVNYFSYKNHLLSIIKNEFLINLILYFPFIFTYELKKLIWIIFFEQETLKSFFRFFQQLPQALRKRRIIMIKKKVGAREIRKWFY